MAYLPVEDRLPRSSTSSTSWPWIAAIRAPFEYFVDQPPGQPLYIGDPPPPTRALLDRGKEVWRQAKCWECHGDAGVGDGPKAAELKDDLKFPIRPADLTTGQFKSGPAVEDIFRTMSTGLSGTPMPSYSDSLPEADAGRSPTTSSRCRPSRIP